MTDFRLKHILKSSLEDEGVKVDELLELVEKNTLSNELLSALNIDSLRGEFIKIEGAGTLVKTQKALNNRFHKEDITSSLQDIFVYREDNEFVFNFENLLDSEYFINLNEDEISVKPIYSARNDFFSSLLGMEKYVTELVNCGLGYIVEENLKMLRERDEISKKKKKYRILHDLNNNELYLRAIISNQYADYDNNIAILIALLVLHKESKGTGINYQLDRVEYNESYIRMFFAECERRTLQGIGFVYNVIEVSNDELKRESLKFDAVSKIEFIDTGNTPQELIIQPSSTSTKIKSRISSIHHRGGVDTAIKKLQALEKSKGIHDSLYAEITEISKIENPSHIVFLMRRKIDKARNEYVKSNKVKLMTLLDNSLVRNTIQLLTLFKKIEFITETDIEASEYIRYLIYEALIERKNS